MRALGCPSIQQSALSQVTLRRLQLLKAVALPIELAAHSNSDYTVNNRRGQRGGSAWPEPVANARRLPYNTRKCGAPDPVLIRP